MGSQRHQFVQRRLLTREPKLSGINSSHFEDCFVLLDSYQTARGHLQVAIKKFNTDGASTAAEADFLKRVHIALLASGTCQRACRILGCCRIDISPCLVMSLYASSAAERLEKQGR